MNVNVDNVCITLSVKRDIYVNDDISLAVCNTVVLYENKDNTFNYDIEEIDLVNIYVKGKKFKYESFGKIKSYIKLIYDICIDTIVDENDYTDEYSDKLGEYIANKYQKVLKIM